VFAFAAWYFIFGGKDSLYQWAGLTTNSSGAPSTTATLGSSSPTVSLSPAPTPVPTETSLIQGNRPPLTGQQGNIHVQDSYVFAAATQADYDAFRKARGATDQIGVYELMAQERLFLIDNGTRVLVLEKHVVLTQVRVLDGPKFGLAVWLPSEFLNR
jgi:hypothetical protein